MYEYNPCMGCEYYNQPYWSIVSPCKNCTKYHNMNGYTTNTTETKLLNDYLNYSYQESLNNLIVDDLIEDTNISLPKFDKGGEFGAGVHLTGSIYDEYLNQGF